MPLTQSVNIRLATPPAPVNINAVPVAAVAAVPAPTITVGGTSPSGYFVATTGSATGAGTIGDPWTLAQACLGGYPTNTLQPGDTVWLRGGTYVGQYECRLAGASMDWIVFRSYPGEWAKIDGVWDPDNYLTSAPNFYMHNWASWLWLRNVELMNSTAQRYEPLPAYASQRGDGFIISAPHSRVTGCVIHDCGQGGFIGSAMGSNSKVSDCLSYHNGHESPSGLANSGVAIDLMPAGGTPVALSGSYSEGHALSPSDTSFPHNNAGDCLIVDVYAAFGTSYTDLSVTYNGVSMTRIVGTDGATDGHGGGGAVAQFGLVAPASGAHNVIASFSSSGSWVKCIAQSFVNVHQTTPWSVAGTWVSSGITLPPVNIAASSASGHMVVDCCGFTYAGPGNDAGVNGDNTLIEMYFSNGTNNPSVSMSYAAGAATVNMGWDWIYGWAGHGHGFYMQEATGGKEISRNIVYDQIGGCTVQAYGSSGADFKGVDFKQNALISDRNQSILGGLTDFSMTDSVLEENAFWHDGGGGVDIGYHMGDYTNLQFINNMVAAAMGLGSSNPAVWDALVMTGNTFADTIQNFTSGDFPSNTHSTPTTNVVVVRPNPDKDTYDPWFGRVYVFNWQSLSTVSVDISSMVPNGTAIDIMNAQDYHGTPVYSGTYNGGTVSLPMTGLSVEAGIGNLHDGPYTVMGATGPGFNAFIVKVQGV